jgi:hypothetical protein
MACWGLNHAGQLGSGTTIDSSTPVGVITSGTPLEGATVTELHVSSYLSCALAADGASACWGSNAFTGVGTGTWDASVVPTAPLGPTRPVDVVAHPGDGNAAVSWSGGTTTTGAISGYAVVPSVGGVRQPAVLVGPEARTATVTGLTDGVLVQFEVVARTGEISGPASAMTASVAPRATSTFVPVTPCRIVDTRVRGGAFARDAQRSYAVTGTGTAFAAQGGRSGGCGIPSGARAVEATVSVVDPSRAGYTRVWPAGQGMPTATFLNFVPRESRTNTGALPLATTGAKQITLRNFGATADYVIDVQGYYADRNSSVAGATFVPVQPCRIADSRSTHEHGYRNREIRSITVRGSGPAFKAQGGAVDGCHVPAEAVAAEVSVSVLSTLEGGGYTRVWPGDRAMPTATFVNSGKRQELTNTGAVRLASSGAADLKIRTFLPWADVVVDIQGYFIPAAVPTDPDSAWPASVYVPMTPCRVVDTRKAGGRLANATVRSFTVRGAGSPFAAQGGTPGGCTIPPNAVAAELAFSAVDAVDDGYLRAYPASGFTPNATILNFAAGSSTTNTGSVALGGTGVDLSVRTASGPTHLVVDVQGYYLPVDQVPT